MSFRVLVVLCISAFISLFLLICSYQSQWQPLPTPALQEWLKSWSNEGLASAVRLDEDDAESASQVNDSSAVASTLQESTSAQHNAHGYTNETYPITNLILASMSYSPMSWLETELSSITDLNYNPMIYVADMQSAPLHPPVNKGNEAMSYLTYLIDFYDQLPEISIFLHNHPLAWHNNYLLDMSTSEMILRLNRTKVLNDGYMNLRCHWNPGCPAHLFPLNATEYDDTKREELLIKGAWEEMFPATSVPEVLAQPCCSQFAVTRERIQAWPKEKYIHLRNWLMGTRLKNYYTGRIFEYTWQYIFKAMSNFCPDPRICYCEGYSVCFEEPAEYWNFFEVVAEYENVKEELDAWGEWQKIKNVDVKVRRSHRSEIVPGGPDASKEGSDARIHWLKSRTRVLEDDMSRMKQKAVDAGNDPVRRAKAIERTRALNKIDIIKGGFEWSDEG